MDRIYEQRGRFEVYLTGPNVMGIQKHLTEIAEGYSKDGNRISSLLTSFNQEEIKPKKEEKK